jgi:ribosome-binding factor A
VGEELRHAMVWVMGHAHLADPGLAGANITITEVKVSPDLKSATVFVTPLGGADLDDTVAALNRAAGFLRGQLGRKISLRYTPRINFAADRSFDYAMRVRDLLDEPRVRRDLGAEAKADADQDGGAAEDSTPAEREEDGHGA